MHEADPECLGGRAPQPPLRLVLVIVGLALGVWMQVPVLHVSMAVQVSVETPAAPADKQSGREEHDHHADERLGEPLGGVR